MGLRQTIEQRPAVAATVAMIVIAIALFVVVRQISGGGRTSQRLLDSEFFSDDDGQTWFVDSKTRIPPFDHHGKQAVGAAVFRCGTGKPFIAYLQRFSTAKKAEIEREAGAHPEDLNGLLQAPMEIKKPGEAKWLPPDAPGGSAEAKAYQKAIVPVCPQGVDGVTHVMPTDDETGASR